MVVVTQNVIFGMNSIINHEVNIYVMKYLPGKSQGLGQNLGFWPTYCKSALHRMPKFCCPEQKNHTW